MTCNKTKCLLCKYSKVGDECNTNTEYEEASYRDLLDRATIYKVKIDYVKEQLEKSKTKNKEDDASKEVKAFKKSLKETIKIKEILDTKLESLNKERRKTDSIFNIEKIKIKEIER